MSQADSNSQLSRLQERVRRQEQELELLAGFSRGLVEARTPKQVIQLLAEQIKTIVDYQSMAMYLYQSDTLVPELVQGPHVERISHAELLDLREPIIRESWERGCSQVRADLSADQSRIFPDETFAATFLMEGRGLIYLGRAGAAGFSASSIRLVSALAQQSGLALRSAEYSVQLESTLVQKRAALEELEVAYQRLQESEMSLVQSSKLAAVGQLAAGVAHELNTPLATILLEVGGLGMDLADDTDGLETVGKIERELRRAQEIVASLLYYSRDGRKGVVEICLNRLVKESLDLMDSQIRVQGAELKRNLNPDLPSVMGNSNEIQQILLNLLLNARDATANRASSVIEVDTSCEDHTVCLAVIDNGPGVEPELESKIFDPFFTTKDVGQGTGLGLSISSQLATKNDGRLTYCRENGKTRFCLNLPKYTGEMGDL